MRSLTWIDGDLPTDGLLKIGEGEEAKLNIAFFSAFPSTAISIEVGENARLEAALADFSALSGKIAIDVKLAKGAYFSWRLSSVCFKGKKEFAISAFHEGEASLAFVSNYGLAKGDGKLIFSGVSKIENGAKRSKTRQEAKIVILDKGADGRCSPVLKIDENDVEASHGASVGRLNDDHLFYLLSRGLDEATGRRLILEGYLRPALSYFDDEGLKQRISEAIEASL